MFLKWTWLHEKVKLLFIFSSQCLDSLWSLFLSRVSFAATCPCSGWSQTSEMVLKKNWYNWGTMRGNLSRQTIKRNWSQHDGNDYIMMASAWPVQWHYSAGAIQCTRPPESPRFPQLGPRPHSDPAIPQHPTKVRCWLSPNIPEEHQQHLTNIRVNAVYRI